MHRLKLKKLLLTTLLSTATLFAGFTNVDCTNQTHLDTLKLPQVECEILDAFWDAMGDGAGWTDKTGWDTVTYAGDWSGIYMNDDNSSIMWFGWAFGNNLIGQLPEEIGNFVKLERIGFHHNTITGEVPSSIDNLRSLEKLQLSDNQLSGSLPKLSL
jgi:hypothetical protein